MFTTRARLAFVATLLASTVVGAQQAPSATPLPKLVVAAPTFDFGALVTGAEMTHTFVIGNEGAAPLILQELRPGMGVKVKSFDATIAPSKTGTVVVYVNSLRLGGQGSTFVDVLSNDPEHATTRLALAWNVKPNVVTRPGYARWNYVQGETEGTIKQLVFSLDGAPFKVLGVDTPQPAIHATYRPADETERDPAHPGPQWRVDLRLDAKAPVGAVEGLVVVKTDHPKQQLVPIEVSGFVRPRYFVEPIHGDLGVITLDAPKTVRFTLRNFAEAPVAITGVETTIPGVTAASGPAESEGHQLPIIVRLDPAAMKAGPFAGKVVVSLSDPAVPTIEFALSGELARPASTPH